jgi:hypothetical protein
MSVDYKIQNRCDHIINWEAITIQSDRKTLYLSYSLGSAASLSIRVNNIVLNENLYIVTTQPNVQNGIFSKTYITFKNSIRLYNPLIEAQYTTLSNFCPKCSGTNYLDDIVYGPDKDVVLAQDEILLIQTLEKFIVTQINSNPYHTWLGTSLHTLIGTKVTDISFLKTKIYNDVKKAVDDLKKMQAQYVSLGRPVSQGELFGDLISIDVTPDPSDQSTVHIMVKFSARSGRVLLFEQLAEANLSQLKLAS